MDVFVNLDSQNPRHLRGKLFLGDRCHGARLPPNQDQNWEKIFAGLWQTNAEDVLNYEAYQDLYLVGRIDTAGPGQPPAYLKELGLLMDSTGHDACLYFGIDGAMYETRDFAVGWPSGVSYIEILVEPWVVQAAEVFVKQRGYAGWTLGEYLERMERAQQGTGP